MATTREQADNAIKAVEEAFEKAEGAWKSAGVSVGQWLGFASGTKDQVLGAIASMRRLGFEPWRARTNKLAATDAAGWARWSQDGQDLLNNLASTAQDAKSASLPRVVVATAVETTKDVAVGAAGAVKTLWNWKGTILFVLVLGAAAYGAWRLGLIGGK